MKWDEFVETALKKLSSASRIPEATVLEKNDNDYFPSNSLASNLPSYLKPVKENLYILFRGEGYGELRFRLPSDTKRLSLEGNATKVKTPPIHKQKVVLQYKEIDNEAYIFLRGYGNQEFNRYAVSIYRVNDNSLITPHYEYNIFPYYKKNIRNTAMMDVLEEIYNKNSTPFDSVLTKFTTQQKVFLYFCVHLFRAEDKGFFSRKVSQVGFDALKQGDTAKDAYKKLKSYQRNEYKILADNDLAQIKKLHDERLKLTGDVDDAYSPVIDRLLGMNFTELKRLFVRLCFHFDLDLTKQIQNITDHQKAYEKTYALVRVYFGDDSL
ncbi:hypothetical protein COE50_10875 [Bacillus anthracis]|nr:hypothetical protein COE50_10875 [Bacillus anthracis]